MLFTLIASQPLFYIFLLAVTLFSTSNRYKIVCVLLLFLLLAVLQCQELFTFTTHLKCQKNQLLRPYDRDEPLTHKHGLLERRLCSRLFRAC